MATSQQRTTRSNRHKGHFTTPSNKLNTSPKVHGAPKKAAPAQPSGGSTGSQAFSDAQPSSPQCSPHSKSKKMQLKVGAAAGTRSGIAVGGAGLRNNTRGTQSPRSNGTVTTARLPRGCMKMAGSLRGTLGEGRSSRRAGRAGTKTTPQQEINAPQSRIQATANASSKRNTKLVPVSVHQGEDEICEDRDKEEDNGNGNEDGEKGDVGEPTSAKCGSKRLLRSQKALPETPHLARRLFLHSVVVPEQDRPVLTARKRAAPGWTDSVKRTTAMGSVEVPKRRRGMVEKNEVAESEEQEVEEGGVEGGEDGAELEEQGDEEEDSEEEGEGGD